MEEFGVALGKLLFDAVGEEAGESFETSGLGLKSSRAGALLQDGLNELERAPCSVEAFVAVGEFCAEGFDVVHGRECRHEFHERTQGASGLRRTDGGEIEAPTKIILP